MPKRPGFERVVDDDLHRDRTDEVVVLVAGVFAGGFTQLVDQRVLDLREARVVARTEVEREGVGHDAATLDVDAAVIVHLAQETAAELDGSDGAAAGGTRKHGVDHIP